MQDLNIVIVQANQLWENKEGNLKHYEQLLNDISTVDLILFPEMFHTGFSMNANVLAETMENSIGIEWLKKIAREKNTAVFTSLIIKEQEHFYNRGLFIEPNGTISIYDKRKTFGLAGEDKIFSPGEKETIVSYKGWKIQLQICYDLRFPELVRNRIEQDNHPAYDVILYVANWPQKRNIHWKTLLKARAIENQCYVIGVNRIGKDNNDLNYSGDSVCVDMLGEETTCKDEIEEIKIVTISKVVLDSTRIMLPFLKDK